MISVERTRLMFERILVLCYGNICRSPAAEFMLRQRLPERFIVDSAGVGALVGRGADETVTQLLQARDIDVSAHEAKQVTRTMLSRFDLVLVMEQEHLEAVTKIAPEARGKTKLLGCWIGNKEIPDPYKKTYEIYELADSMIAQAVDSWMNYLG